APPTVTNIPIAADINDRTSRHQSADPARARTWPACLGHPAATPPWSQNLGPAVPLGTAGPGATWHQGTNAAPQGTFGRRPAPGWRDSLVAGTRHTEVPRCVS